MFRALTAALSIGMPVAATADDVALSVRETLTAQGVQLPYAVYMRFFDVTPTRMGVDAFVDLRGIQANAPGLLSRVLDETCKRKLAVAIADVSAKGEDLTVRGQFQAKFYRCNTKDPKIHYRKAQILGQNVNFKVTAQADVRHPCVRARLVALDLDPLGFLGSVVNLFGVTALAERLITEKAGEVLNDNPVCPKLPSEIASLDPRFSSGGAREIGESGVGAALSGSVDTSAATLLDLVRVMKTRGVLGPENE